MTKLFDVFQWLEGHGEVRALTRLRIKTMPHAIAEGVCFDDVTAETVVSDEFLEVIIKIATEIVGEPCPI